MSTKRVMVSVACITLILCTGLYLFYDAFWLPHSSTRTAAATLTVYYPGAGDGLTFQVHSKEIPVPEAMSYQTVFEEVFSSSDNPEKPNALGFMGRCVKRVQRRDSCLEVILDEYCAAILCTPYSMRLFLAGLVPTLQAFPELEYLRLLDTEGVELFPERGFELSWPLKLQDYDDSALRGVQQNRVTIPGTEVQVKVAYLVSQDERLMPEQILWEERAALSQGEPVELLTLRELAKEPSGKAISVLPAFLIPASVIVIDGIAYVNFQRLYGGMGSTEERVRFTMLNINLRQFGDIEYVQYLFNGLYGDFGHYSYSWPQKLARSNLYWQRIDFANTPIPEIADRETYREVASFPVSDADFQIIGLYGNYDNDDDISEFGYSPVRLALEHNDVWYDLGESGAPLRENNLAEWTNIESGLFSWRQVHGAAYLSTSFFQWRDGRPVYLFSVESVPREEDLDGDGQVDLVDEYGTWRTTTFLLWRGDHLLRCSLNDLFGSRNVQYSKEDQIYRVYLEPRDGANYPCYEYRYQDGRFEEIVR